LQLQVGGSPFRRRLRLLRGKRHPRRARGKPLPGRNPGGGREPPRGGVVPRVPRTRAERRGPAEAQWYDPRVTPPTRMRARYAALVTVLALRAAAAQAQHIYRGTDEQSRTHIPDTPPPASARSVQKQGRPAPGVAAQMPYELARAMQDFPVTLYTAPNCT